jgi:nucleoside-diphosphate-sugar epimerase
MKAEEPRGKRTDNCFSEIETNNVNHTVQQITKESDKLISNFKSRIRQDRHILVIGGAGYIGSVLVRKCLSRGYKVRVLDELLYDNGISISDLMEEESFSFVCGDFGNETILRDALRNVTDVVLLAALVGDPICRAYPKLATKTNIEYPKQLIQVLKGSHIRNFIFTSTCSNYGLRAADDSLASEDSELNPQSLYAETKVEVERYILENIGRLDYSPTILRLSTAFGMSSRMRFDLTISEFTKDLALGKKLVVYDENTWRPYCNVSDISNAIIKVIETSREKVHGQVFNIGSDNNNYTKRMIVELISKHVKNTEIEYREGGSDARNYRVSFEKVRTILGFNAHFSVEDSIMHIVYAMDNRLFTDTDARRTMYGNYVINK